MEDQCTQMYIRHSNTPLRNKWPMEMSLIKPSQKFDKLVPFYYHLFGDFIAAVWKSTVLHRKKKLKALLMADVKQYIYHFHIIFNKISQNSQKEEI